MAWVVGSWTVLLTAFTAAVLVVLLLVFAKLVLSVGEFALLAVWANSKLYELFAKLRFFLVMRGELGSRRGLS